MKLVYLPYEYKHDVSAALHDHCTDEISQPLLDFLSNLTEDHLVSELKEEMIIELTGPENEQEVTNEVFNEAVSHLVVADEGQKRPAVGYNRWENKKIKG